MVLVTQDLIVMPCAGPICCCCRWGIAFGSRVFSMSFLTCSSNASSSKDLLQQQPQHPAWDVELRPLPYVSESCLAKIWLGWRNRLRTWVEHVCKGCTDSESWEQQFESSVAIVMNGNAYYSTRNNWRKFPHRLTCVDGYGRDLRCVNF